MEEVIFVSGNREKIAIVKEIFKDSKINVSFKKIDCPEIQSEDGKEVAGFSARWAANKLGKPVLKNDSFLEIEALNGFPSFSAKYVEKWLGADGFLRLMKGIKNRKAKYLETTAFCKPGEEPIIFQAETILKIAEEKSGTHGWEMDNIFIVNGCKKTMANYPDEERLKLLNNDHYRKAKECLEKLD